MEIKQHFSQKNWRDCVLSKMNLQKIIGCSNLRDDGVVTRGDDLVEGGRIGVVTIVQQKYDVEYHQKQ